MSIVSKLRCRGLTFVLITTLFFTLLQNALALTAFWHAIAETGRQHWLFMATVPVTLFCALNIVFSLLLLPWLRKPLVIILLLGGAYVNYVMYSFNVVIDRNMMQNALETDYQEIMALITPKMMLWILLLGVLPSVLVIAVKIQPAQHWLKAAGKRLANIALSLLVILIIAFFFYKDYAPLIRNHPHLVKMLVPTNYISGLTSALKREVESRQPLVDIGMDAREGSVIKQEPKKTLVILVVGETARAANFSLGGYSRETNPKLKQNNIIYFPHTTSCGTETAVSVPCMFSDMTRKEYDAVKAAHQEGLMDIVARAKVSVLWRENDGGCKGACDRIPHQDMTQLKPDGLCHNGSCYDDALLSKLDNYINGLTNDGLIVLHQMGSHGPAYFERYPAEYRQFTPTCDSNQIQDCDHQSLINTYDNTLLYTDAMLDKTLSLLKSHQQKFATALVYLSDHGESLGEKGLYLHGTPYLLAPDEQTHIPFLMWMSDDYKKDYQIDSGCLENKAQQQAFSQDNLFHTILGMLDIKTQEYKSELDILQGCRARE
ncbi:phosphoethanolamine transferase EptA [Budviciaceae bacterium BWR-B9]|uniref:Phosphoethanolamine transferase EptA n=1 Tax=Limnobaculum allomyrinae TaxID=2791986 RepID=A0ABS1IP57_9GAMM|nr:MULTISPECIES: phosphoethanolamine transferase EptA [Limnobaculum]MBK5143492.1 phosphoethanolamine transferase EptA [Limnobaculum allomyrinae]MBV7691380.1 phosphoethanolamine transferase EptA [Limnobaculum sp. M2-1]